ncbi:hypothetical protein DRO97_02180 [Archaeoglobales archaeon]|nr:MAG: hypothetical protein DRO97_02180 [Archaeoglobales archaeon]
MEKSKFENFVKIELDIDEFDAVMRNLDSWERLKNVKFIEAEIIGNKAVIKAMPVATPGFFVLVQNKKARLMAELVADTRVGYIDLEELAEFDAEILDNIKYSVVCEDNSGTLDKDGRYFPKSEKSVELYKKLMRTAKWK